MTVKTFAKAALLALALLPATASAQAFRLGKGFQLVPRATAPSSVAGNGVVYVDSSAANQLRYCNPAASCIYLGAGGGGSTLATAYAAGASNTDEIIVLDSTRFGIRIRDNATPIAGSLFQVQNNGATATFLDISAAATLTLRSGVVDGASAVAQSSDTTTAWSTTGAKLMQWNTNAVEQLSLKKNGVAWSLLFANSAYINSNKADGASSIGTIDDTVVSFVTAGAKIASWQTAGAEKLSLKLAAAGWGLDWGTNAGFHTSSIATGSSRSAHVFNDVNAAAGTDVVMAWQIGGTNRLVFRQDRFLGNLTGVGGISFLDVGTLQLWAGNINVATVNTSNISSTTDHQTALGTSLLRYSSTWSRQYNGEQPTDVANAASVTFTVGNGEMQRFAAGPTAMTISGTAGGPSEHITACIVEDPTGTRTASFATGANNFKVAGGAFTLTATANKIDCVSFVWDVVGTVWLETSRAQNL